MLGLFGAGEAVVFLLGQAALEFRLVLLDGLHGLFQRLGDVFLLREIEEIVVPGVRGQVEATLGDGDLSEWLLAAGSLELLELGLDGLLMLAVVNVGKLEEDEPQNRGAVFRSLEVRIGPKVIRGRIERFLKLLELISIHQSASLRAGLVLSVPYRSLCGHFFRSWHNLTPSFHLGK